MNRPQDQPPDRHAGGGNEHPDALRPAPAPKQPEFELSDELVMCCLDQVSWKPMVRPRIIGLGIGACLIGQLLAFGRVQLVDRSLMLSYTAQPPTTVLLLEVWETVKAEHTAQPVKTWLLYLAEQGLGPAGSFARVADRMVSRGLLAVERQGILGRRNAYVPTDPSAAAWPLARLRQNLNRRDLPVPAGRDAFLAGLLSSMGLEPRLADGDPGRARLRSAVAGLEPPIRSLLGHLDAAVGEAAMTRRP